MKANGTLQNGASELSHNEPPSDGPSDTGSPNGSSSSATPHPSSQTGSSPATTEPSAPNQKADSETSFPDKTVDTEDTNNDGARTPPTPTAPVPTNAQLLDAILPIRSSAPTLGVPKLLNKLKELNPSWQLSEKRLRKFLNSNPNLSPQAPRHQARGSSRAPCEPMWLPDYAWEKDWEAASAEHSSTEPVSSLDDTLLLECRQRSVKVEPVRFPASNKGSGLIAKDHIPRGTQIIKEDAFVWVPPNKNLSRSVISGQNCAFCGRAFSVQRTKGQPSCPHHPAPGSKEAIAAQQLVTTTSTSLTTGSHSVTEKPAGPEPCYMRYCTRVCAQRSADYFGPLVCPQKNPEYMQLMRYADAEEFRGVHMVFKLFARMLIANESGEISTDPAFRPPEAKNEQECSTNGVDGKGEQGGATNGDLEPDHTGSDEPTGVSGKKGKKTKSKKKVIVNPVLETSGTSVEFEKVVSRIAGLATISDRARRERFHGGGHLGSHFTDVRYGQMWRNGWHTVIRALHINTGYRSRQPNADPNSTDVFWETFWKRRLRPETIAHYFGLKSFLEFIGKASLNTEIDHGLYLLHARFNHSCDPNATVLKHPGSEDIHKLAPSTIYVVSKRDVSKDEEITISYVNPEMSLESRRKKLFEDYLFSCFCTRCRRELKEEESRKSLVAAVAMENGKEAIQEIGSEVAALDSSFYNLAPREDGEDESMIDELRAVFS